jgi:hypothetical protein
MDRNPPSAPGWFHGWLVENRISSEAEAFAATQDPKGMGDLIRRAEEHQPQPLRQHQARSIMAGRSLDLTEYVNCGNPDCITRQVDRLFSRVWYYFDKVFVVGPESHWFLHFLATNPSPETVGNRVATWSRPIYHIRAIGAENLIGWIDKPPPCRVHWKEFDALGNYQLMQDAANTIANTLMNEGTLWQYQPEGYPPELVLSHPQLFEGSHGYDLTELQAAQKAGVSLESVFISKLVQTYWLGAASDLYTASTMHLPIGLGAGLEATMAQALGTKAAAAPLSVGDVAFNLSLPVVDGLPVKELLAVRAAEQDAFETFRDSLTRAIKERLASGGDSEPADKIAGEIQEDVIEPALHEIKRRLHVAENALVKSHRYNIVVAGLATVCGLIGALPLAIPLAVGAVAGAVTVESKFISDKKNISLSDMYFLWQAKEHADERRSRSPAKPDRLTKRPHRS